ncbi:class I SAM-dependent methyltransferase [Methylomonas sp. 11b]|uniref:class I SAM-dependent methyltransferase n=1 Tax=Methylomonas sp. 11b TaxID=1168169 RepID=UPI00047DD134|nr:methyltransferase domain-containing protein [Methylomonas sp. 11b]
MNPEMDEWLDRLHTKVAHDAPELLELFNTYAGEARFGRTYIEPNLQQLTSGAQILEVGAGALILSSQLVREGYRVTALEPTGEGFSHFDRLRSLVVAQAIEDKCMPVLLEIPAESLEIKNRFDFAFSINVMEHVGNVEAVINSVSRSLACGGAYRFACPNYMFPYEAHFNVPTLGSKKLTEKVFLKSIRNRKDLQDPEGLWNSLNWITVPKIRNVVVKNKALKVYFGKKLFYRMLERLASDPIFSARRTPWMRQVLKMVVGSGLHKIAILIPPIVQPVIDCTLVRSETLESFQ